MKQTNITNNIEGLKLNLLDNEEFYANGDIDEETYVYTKQQIEMKLNYYLSMF